MSARTSSSREGRASSKRNEFVRCRPNARHSFCAMTEVDYDLCLEGDRGGDRGRG